MKVALTVLLIARMGLNAKIARVIRGRSRLAFVVSTVVALVVAGWASPAASQNVSDDPDLNGPQALPETWTLKGASWYGYQTFAADALAVTLFLAAGDSSAAGWAVAGLYVLGGPTVHALHRRPGAVAGSLALRIVVPFIGAALGAATADCSKRVVNDENCDFGPGLIGFGFGLGVAMILDSALIAWDPAPKSPRVAPISPRSVSLFPVPLRGGGGLVWGGLF